MQVSSIVPQVEGVIFTPTAQPEPLAGVAIIIETETVSNTVLGCLMLLLQKSNLSIKG